MNLVTRIFIEATSFRSKINQRIDHLLYPFHRVVTSTSDYFSFLKSEQIWQVVFITSISTNPSKVEF